MSDWLPAFAHSSALWLLPVLLILLVFLRFFQTRRRDLHAGSLMLWRRLAAQQPKLPPRRFILDRSLLLQALALAALVLALAGPSLALSNSQRQAMVLMLDNGPTSRARVDGQSGFSLITT